MEMKRKGQQSLEDTSIYNWKVNDLEHLKIGYDVIKLATEDFATKYIIGKGGYGSVYKAELECVDSSMINGDGTSELPKRRRTVAIKYITEREDTQGQQGFITEIKTLASCRHPNIVSLLGFCDQHPHLILVYEFVSNGSLDNYLGNRGKMTNLTWLQRIKICIDIAQGLGYIHTTLENKLKIIHRDIKSANILLDKNWEAKIADFGLSKFHPRDNTKSVINTNNIAGTNWYLDPEYESTGNLRKESDVYSFGVVLFEIMSGRLANDWPVHTSKHENCFAQIVRQHIEEATIMEMIDPNLMEESDVNSFTLRKGPNQESLDTFLKIGCQCLEEKQAQRPTMNVVINELVKALTSQETHKDNLQISFQEIMFATQNFNNQIGCGGFGKVYKGEILSNNGPIPIAVKRLDKKLGQGDQEFLTEIEILSEYKHKNIVDLVGYCNEDGESILVYEYTSNGSLDRHLKDANVTWTQRLKIAIDVATGLDFLHRSDSSVVHKDIKSANILLNGDWKAKLTDFGLSMIIPTNNEFDFVSDYVSDTMGYIDPLYRRSGFLTRESDIYSLGVVLFELICGRNAIMSSYHDERRSPDRFVKRCYEQGQVDVLVLESIKHKIAPKSLTTYHRIAHECLHYEREKRPTASEVVLQLKKALEFQEDNEIWAVKLRDYKEIVQMSKVPEKYPDISNKSLYDMVSNGILLQKDKLLFSVNNNGERNEMVSATMFSYENNRLHKRISIQNSRFKRVVKILDISNLNIQIKIKTRFLSPNVIYGAHFVFKFSDPRKISSKLMYVNLKYQMRREPLHAYFATCGDNEWMMIELCRFIPNKNDVQFEVLLESLSKYYCGNNTIYVDGIHFRAINDATLKLFSPCKVSEKICYRLPAKMVLFESSDIKRFNWKSLAESRFQEVAELLSHQLFQIKCKIETQKLLPDTNYECYLVFELSHQCHGLHCPVKVQDVLLRKNKELKFVYFKTPRLVNLHSNGRVPKQTEDGLMEVIVWEFNSGNKPSDDHLRMSLKLRCYEGDMCGLMVHGLEFRPV
ncbi:hypothetical protein SSX86_012638 [Deinandra increscens subsp. villosa]|uniref:non-specific serine/threonine protein kinase n=1 Tax=Deinandra increscens subsp. villosa TaxID=3103831 RepID=A0AAP0D526_9ASTR